MNQKIKELRKRAITETVEHYYYKGSVITRHLDEEKFAELIIKECISTCERLQDDLDRQNWPTPYGCAEAIKEHFGIAKGE